MAFVNCALGLVKESCAIVHKLLADPRLMEKGIKFSCTQIKVSVF